MPWVPLPAASNLGGVPGKDEATSHSSSFCLQSSLSLAQLAKPGAGPPEFFTLPWGPDNQWWRFRSGVGREGGFGVAKGFFRYVPR